MTFHQCSGGQGISISARRAESVLSPESCAKGEAYGNRLYFSDPDVVLTQLLEHSAHELQRVIKSIASIQGMMKFTGCVKAIAGLGDCPPPEMQRYNVLSRLYNGVYLGEAAADKEQCLLLHEEVVKSCLSSEAEAYGRFQREGRYYSYSSELMAIPLFELQSIPELRKITNYDNLIGHLNRNLREYVSRWNRFAEAGLAIPASIAARPGPVLTLL